MLENIYYYKLTDADDNRVYTYMDYHVALSMVEAVESSKHEYRFEKIQVIVLKEHEDYEEYDREEDDNG